MDLSLYFEALHNLDDTYASGTIGSSILSNTSDQGFPDLQDADIAIFGVNEDRSCYNNHGCSQAPDFVRKFLYKLYQGSSNSKIVDLGNIAQGHSIEDTYFALTNVVSQLIKNNTVPIIIGGSQDLTYANYLAYEKLEQTVNLVSVDPTFDIGDPDHELNSNSYLSKIIVHQPSFLFNYSNIGYQTYFADQGSIELIDKLFFDAIRLGVVRANMEEVEPIVRNADVLSFDVSSIRQADAPGNKNATPNGFSGEEACQIARYAGLSDKLTSIGFYEINPTLDPQNQTAHLVAQMIWYFIDGYNNRKKDYPVGLKTDYLKYRVVIKDSLHEIVFYKSNKSDRWWMDVPYPSHQKIKYERHHLVPCSYKDYQIACNDEMPDRWWKTFQKLS
jgi:formiminoglutamase